MLGWPASMRRLAAPRLGPRLAPALAFLLALMAAAPAAAVNPETIARVKASVVGVGTFEATRSPQFRFLGTGFAVGDGSLVATNAHVLPKKLD
ncbi:MAG: serine protease, partial [Burkholderiales bacterium]